MRILPCYFSESGPGAALAIAADGKAAHIECHGLANLDSGIEITSDTVFDLASGSKTFTATGIMLLIERGLLDMSSPVHDFLPNFCSSRIGRPVSIADLLWHTSGLPDYLESGMYTPSGQMSSEFVNDQLQDWSQKACPGQSHVYSNTNYFVLSRVMEAVAECSYAEFIESNLIAPLGLGHTFVAGGRLGVRQSAVGYRNDGYGLPLVGVSEDIALDTVGDGGVFSSLKDLVEWQAALWNGRIVNEKSLGLMQSPGFLDSGERLPYGCGLQIERREGGDFWCGHGGSWTSSTVLIGRHVDKRVSVIMLSNEFMAPVERIAQRAFAMQYRTELTRPAQR
jgi:CubicO group peptidase (beta-lactamase class C family)